MMDSCIFVIIPAWVGLPMSTPMFFEKSYLDQLDEVARNELSSVLVMSGIASIFAFFGFGFGCLGKCAPQDIFLRDFRFKHDKECCCICLSKFDYNCRMRVLKCNHAFHKECLSSWNKKGNTCPVCRASISFG